MSDRVCIGIVSPWPKIKNAEFEIIERIKIAIISLGHQWVVVDGNGILVSSSEDFRGEGNVFEGIDFCVSLHFISPKLWEPFTYLAMWNPPRYYHDSDYEEVMAHVGSYDDYLLYDSAPIKNHLLNFLRGSGRNLQGAIEFYSGGAGRVFPVLTELPEDSRLFYCGINWEKLSGTRGRHHELLTLLDREGLTKIYGPEKFEGVKPWEGFRTYQGAINFDGVSIFSKLREAGVALVLSGYDHVLSEAASNRIYEAINAGVVILSDRNPFVVKEFGDSILYFDYGDTWEKTAANIKSSYEWILAHPKEALFKAKCAQDIYCNRHTLEASLSRLIQGHGDRLRSFKERVFAHQNHKVVVILPFKNQTLEFFSKQLRSIEEQNGGSVQVFVILDSEKMDVCREFLLSFTNSIEISTVIIDDKVKGFNLHKFRIGHYIACAIRELPPDIYAYAVLAEDELWHKAHLSSLLRVMEDKPEANIVVAGSYFQDPETGKRSFGHYVLSADQLYGLSSISYEEIRFSALFRHDNVLMSEEHFRLLDLMDSRIPDVFLIESMKKIGRNVLSYNYLMSSFFVVLPSGQKKMQSKMAANYMRDFYRHDNAYLTHVYKFGRRSGSSVDFDEIRKKVVKKIRKKVEGKFYYKLVVWFYRKFVVSVLY